jgi:hypothetical protein
MDWWCKDCALRRQTRNDLEKSNPMLLFLSFFLSWVFPGDENVVSRRLLCSHGSSLAVRKNGLRVRRIRRVRLAPAPLSSSTLKGLLPMTSIDRVNSKHLSF